MFRHAKPLTIFLSEFSSLLVGLYLSPFAMPHPPASLAKTLISGVSLAFPPSRLTDWQFVYLQLTCQLDTRLTADRLVLDVGRHVTGHRAALFTSGDVSRGFVVTIL